MITQEETAAKRILTKRIQTNLAGQDHQPVETQAVVMMETMMTTTRFQPSTDTLCYQARNGLPQVTDQANQKQSFPLCTQNSFTGMDKEPN